MRLKELNWRWLLTLVAAISLSATVTACGDDDDDEPTPDNNDRDVAVNIKESDLCGTWRYTADGYGNIDYLSFDGDGNGMMAIAADQFSCAGSHRSSTGAFELVTFSYDIDENIINVFPDEPIVKDFTIEVFDVSDNSLDILIGLDIVRTRRTMKLYDSDWEWFTKNGPASMDLTAEFTGNYVVDGSSYHKLQVVKVNNYTVTVKDLYKDSEVTGFLFWDEVYGPSCGGDVFVRSMTSSTTSNSYFFTAEGKLKSMAGSHFFSGTASKVEGNESGNESGDSTTKLAGTKWGGMVEDDFYYEIEFYANGTFKELCRVDGESESDTYKYTIVGDETLIIEEGCVMNNTFGDQVSFKITDTTLKLFDTYETWTLSRKL